ncbi:MAG: pyridoxamine 5'-phosphate oxidase family protein [Terriglobales bacterium]
MPEPLPGRGAPSERTRVRLLPERGAYEFKTICAILDSGFLCHIGFVSAGGYPAVIPTAYGRRGEFLYVHGSAASHMLRSLRDGIELCCTVTHLDGLVLARSVFNHSMNYRSVVVYGRARVIDGSTEKLTALEAISNQIAPGRWEAARLPTAKELKATMVLELPLSEASAKIRSGPPKDEPEDYALPIWAGVVPVRLTYGRPEPDPRLSPDTAMPEPLLGMRLSHSQGT